MQHVLLITHYVGQQLALSECSHSDSASCSCTCRKIPPDDKQLIYSKHVEDYYRKVNRGKGIFLFDTSSQSLKEVFILTMKGFHFMGEGINRCTLAQGEVFSNFFFNIIRVP